MLLKNNLDRSLIERIYIDCIDQLYSEGEDYKAENLQENDIRVIDVPLREINVIDIDDSYLYPDMKISEAYNYLMVLSTKKEYDKNNQKDGDVVKYPVIVKNESSYGLYDGFHRITALKMFKENQENPTIKKILENNPLIKKIVDKNYIEVLDISKYLEIHSDLKIIPKKLEFYQYCNKFQTHSNPSEDKKRKRIWNTMMNKSERITEEEFHNNVDTESLIGFMDEEDGKSTKELFEDWMKDSLQSESTEDLEYMKNHSQTNKEVGFFKAKVDGNPIYYIRTAGFENICLDSKKFRLTKSPKIESRIDN